MSDLNDGHAKANHVKDYEDNSPCRKEFDRYYMFQGRSKEWCNVAYESHEGLAWIFAWVKSADRCLLTALTNKIK